MKLFFVSPLNQDPDLVNWFIVAQDAKEAWTLYRAEPGVPIEFEEEDKNCCVFELPGDQVGPARALDWYDDVKMVLEFAR